MTDVYAFDSDGATVLAMIVNSSLAGAGRVAGFHPEGRYEFNIHFDGATTQQLTYRFSFAPADALGTQHVAIDRLVGTEAGDDRAAGAHRPVGKSVIAAADRLAVADAPARAALLAYGAPLESADEVLEIIASVKTFDRGATTTYQLGHAAACVGAVDVSEALLAQAVDTLRSEGRLHTLGIALVLLSWSALRLGRWSTAVSAAEEGGRLCAETDQPFWHACALAAHAVRGGADGCGPIGTPTGAGWVAALWQGQRVRSQACTGGLLR